MILSEAKMAFRDLISGNPQKKLTVIDIFEFPML
jgi:hypothetical protein